MSEKTASSLSECEVQLPPPLVSVIVTTKNEIDTIEECITSILKQSYPNFELIIIDASSNDRTFDKEVELEIISQSYVNCKRYLFSSEEANSPAKGRNIGAMSAYGTILAFTDGDCIAEKDWLMNLVEYLPKESGIVGGPNILKHFKNSKILEAIDNVLATFLGSGGSPQFIRIDKVSEVYAVPSCNMAIQKSLFDAVGGFNERFRYNEDSELCKRIQERGLKIIYSPQAKVNHFMGLDSLGAFSNFVYKYGFERGKNIAHNMKLFTRFNGLSITLLLLSLSLIVLSFFTLTAVTILLSIIFFLILVVIFFSIKIAVVNKSSILGFLALPIYISIFFNYNTGLLIGYISQKAKTG